MSIINKDNYKVSVIVPIYNSEKYLAKCIESLIVQKYNNLEILLIDDGSMDSSGPICDKYSKKDSRIRVIYQKNAGVASARNVGIDNATGEYVCFVDSDDWLPENSINDLMTGICESGADICVGSMVRIFLQKKIKMETDDDLILMNDYKTVAKEVFRKESPLVFIAAKLYKLSIIRKYGLTYDEEMKLFEDACFVFRYLRYCESIKFIDKNVYYYNQIMTISASRKFYIEYNKWAYSRFSKQVELVNGFKHSIEGKKLLDSELVKIFRESCSHYINSTLPEVQIKKKIKENEQLLLPLISRDGIKLLDNYLRTAIEDDDFNYLKRIFTKPSVKNSSSILYKIKSLVKVSYNNAKMFLVFDVRIAERLHILKRKYKMRFSHKDYC